jgi:uncharacterized protein (UPF0276 family)
MSAPQSASPSAHHSAPARSIARTGTGFGLGLRTPHYNDFLTARQPLDWLEIITDNFLVEGGKPLVMLDRLRRDYPMAMHGVAMSIGGADGIDKPYLHRVKALADRIEPLWVSDHLCWTGTPPQHLHDLYPLPYTDKAARHVIKQIGRAQDILQRRLVLENVSSYIDFKYNASSEWQFLAHIAQAADCLLLLDVNNVYVSSVNHGFDPMTYLRALPAARVQQIHLAGHSHNGSYIIDTHDHPVAQPVWDLYAQACRLFGSVATMIERDDDIPDLATLIAELGIAQRIATDVAHEERTVAPGTPTCATASLPPAEPAAAETPAASAAPALRQVQSRIADYILNRPTTDQGPATELIRTPPGASADQRLGIYHHAYRARLAEVLAESFAKTYLYMGSDQFDRDAKAFAVSHPPTVRNLGRYGTEFVDYLAALYPANPELRELAQLDWDLRTTFDGPDVPALDAATANAGTHTEAGPQWLNQLQPLHPSLKLRAISTNVVQIWRAIDMDAEVPEVVHHEAHRTLMVWRKALQPHFQTLEPDQATFMQALAAGGSIDATCTAFAGTEVLPDPQRLAAWLQAWLEDGLLRSA